MFKVVRVMAVFGAGALCASIAAADPDSPTRTRVTIRGTGNGVSIERTQAPARRLSDRLPPGPLGEAIRLKREGADDAGVIAYLRFHGADLPPVIEATEVRLLRNAGAGKSVTNFLATVSAVDLGPMGEGHVTVVAAEPPAEPEFGMPAYGASSGYFTGGFGYAPASPRVGHRHFPHHHVRPMEMHPSPRFRPTLTTRAAVGRFPDSP